MGPAFSKLITKKSNTSSTLEPVVPQFTIEDMEFDATVISSETDIEPVIKPDLQSDLQPDLQPDVLPPVAPVQESVSVPIALLPEPVLEQLNQVEEEPIIKEKPEDKTGKKDKKEKRKKLRKDSL